MMTGNYQYTMAQQRIAELIGEADRERLAAPGPSRAARTDRPSRLLRISRRLTRLSAT
jgi:hypothetical protein